MECGDHKAWVAGVLGVRVDAAGRVGQEMIILGYFFIMLIGPHQVAMGPYADLVSCQDQAALMEGEGAVTSVCYGKSLPDPDATVELEWDSVS